MAADKLRDAEIKSGLHTFFKLQTTISTTSMVLFDHLGCLKCVLFSNFFLGKKLRKEGNWYQ